MSVEEANRLFDRLNSGVVLVAGERLVPVVSPYKLGSMALVCADEQAGEFLVSPRREVIQRLLGSEPRWESVGRPWLLMRRAASEGLCGISFLPREGDHECHFMFMLRVEEAGEILPTVLVSNRNGHLGPALTRTGVREFAHSEVFHWERFDVLDAASALWGEECPFRDWEEGDPFFELRSDDALVLVANVPLLGDWNSTVGAFAFFTEEAEARHYLEAHLFDGQNRLLPISDRPPVEADVFRLGAGLQVVPVTDLATRLQELRQIVPDAAWCVNPDDNRENAAYGRLDYDGPHPCKIGGLEDDGVPRLGCVTGIWKVLPDNWTVKEEPFSQWSGLDTIGWSGGQGLQLAKLTRSFEAVQSPLEGLEFLEGLTPSEAEEWMEQRLAANLLEEVCRTQQVSRLRRFYLAAWNSITGQDMPFECDCVLDALALLASYERIQDQPTRVEGTCGGLSGFCGSDDHDHERERGQRFQLGLKLIGKRILLEGYRPADANHLVSLCNACLRTLHVDFAGYATDLLWASPPEQQEELLEGLSIDPKEWLEWSQSTEPYTDPKGQKRVLERVGADTWKLLSPHPRHFLVTALTHLEQQGHTPLLDYAPISMEVVKALESELGELLKHYRSLQAGKTIKFDEANQTEREFGAFLQGDRPPSLGAIARLLRAKPEGRSALLDPFAVFVRTLPNAAFLTSRAFAKDGLGKVVHKFRNGGVHDKPISEDTCLDCVRVLVGTQAEPGFISRVVAWKTFESKERTRHEGA